MAKPNSSRQNQQQIARRKTGLCRFCPNPSQGRVSCDDCAVEKIGVKYRKPLREAWAAVDWSRPDYEIAAEFKVTTTAVAYQRKKLFTK